MRKSILWFVFLTLLTIQSAFAQGFYVKGKVISQEDNEPLIGVSILQEGSGNGVVTDIDGNYSLEVKGTTKTTLGEFYQFNLSSCIRQQNSLTAQFVSFSLANLANIFYPPDFYNN